MTLGKHKLNSFNKQSIRNVCPLFKISLDIRPNPFAFPHFNGEIADDIPLFVIMLSNLLNMLCLRSVDEDYTCKVDA